MRSAASERIAAGAAEEASMVRVDLETQEAEELRAILENYLSDLRMEIVDTEGHDFREMLKKRRDLVGRLIEQLIEQLKAS
jgi:hypothetical protein